MPLRIKLIEDLPMASSAELYQLSWVIEQLLADPRRIVQMRAQLNLGQQVQFWSWDNGKLRAARIVSMKDRVVTLQDEQSQQRIGLPYAAIVTADEYAMWVSSAKAHAQTASPPLAPPPEIRRKQDFRVGQRVSFADQNLQRHVGEIVRINQRTATVHCDGRAWRVSFGLLQHIDNVAV